ncbi:MAG: glycosyltransferase family 4 protein [Methylococcales bacterium]|nr:glycosyltransferase family 4 protein [Methylococcales bacterium]
MHIILNVESLLKPSGGIGRYTQYLLEGLLESDEVDKVSCFGGLRWIDSSELIQPNFASENNTADTKITQKIKPLPTTPHSKLRQLIASIPFLKIAVLRSLPFAYHLYAKYNATMFQRKAKVIKNALYHEPNYILKPFDGACITTVHDLSFIHCPEYHPKERVVYLKKKLVLTLEKASHIITDSEFVRKELIAQMKVKPEDVSTVLLGVDDNYHPRTASELASVLSKHQLIAGQYLLSVSTLEPRKNILAMLDAYMLLDKALRQNYPLIIVGGDGWRNQPIKDKIARLVKQGEVTQLGYVSNEDLPYIFAGARGFVFVPFYEGFGLPPLEAMASGIPVLTTPVSSIPEVVGDVAILVDPNNTSAISEGMVQLLTDNQWRLSAIEKGLLQAKKFTWARCVEQTIAIYKQVLN